MKILIYAGADIYQKDNSGKTPLELFKYMGSHNTGISEKDTSVIEKEMTQIYKNRLVLIKEDGNTKRESCPDFSI